MNQNTQYYNPTSSAGVVSTTSRGWGVPFLAGIMGVALIFGALWVVLSKLFESVGPSASAVIVLLAVVCLGGGIGLTLLVMKNVAHNPPPARPTFSGYTIDNEPTGRGTPLIPSRSGLRTEDAKVALTFTNKQVREIPAAAMAWFFSRRGPEDMVRGTNGWRWANEAYSVGRAWLIDQQALRNDNAWIDKQSAMEHLGLWSDHAE